MFVSLCVLIVCFFDNDSLGDKPMAEALVVASKIKKSRRKPASAPAEIISTP